jgi:hypothetical protein
MATPDSVPLFTRRGSSAVAGAAGAVGAALCVSTSGRILALRAAAILLSLSVGALLMLVHSPKGRGAWALSACVVAAMHVTFVRAAPTEMDPWRFDALSLVYFVAAFGQVLVAVLAAAAATSEPQNDGPSVAGDDAPQLVREPRR